MRNNFDPTLEANRLVRMVTRALRTNNDTDYADAQILVSKFRNDELEALASELDGCWSNPISFQPYARVIRNANGAIKAISFYPGWLDIKNWGKEIRIATYALRYEAKQKVH